VAVVVAEAVAGCCSWEPWPCFHVGSAEWK
jgi:hypothetical protein